MKKRWEVICCIFPAVLFGAALIGYIKLGIDGVPNFSLFHVGYNVIAMFLSIILFACCVADGAQMDRSRGIFLIMLFMNFIAQLLDCSSYFLDYKPQFRTMHTIELAILFFLDSLIYYSFILYIAATLELEKEKPVRIILCICGFVSAVFAVIALIQIKIPIYFAVDSNGVYGRLRPYIFFSMFHMLIVISIYAIAFIYRKRLELYQLIAIVNYGIALQVQVIIHQNTGLCLEYSIITLLLLIMYVVLNLENDTRTALKKSELDTARNIQAGILPNLFPDFVNVPEFEICALMSPAKEVGGDFYDFFMLDENRLAFSVGEVSHHNIGGALFMAVSKSMINMSANLEEDPARVLEKVNSRIVSAGYSYMSASVWLGSIDLRTGHMYFSDAGIPMFAVQDHNDGVFRCEENIRSFPLGESLKVIYCTEEMDLEPGDRIFLYTSGVTSPKGKSGEEYGTDRLLQALNENRDKNNEDLCNAVRESIEGFSGSLQPGTDITMLSFTFKKPRQQSKEEKQ